MPIPGQLRRATSIGETVGSRQITEVREPEPESSGERLTEARREGLAPVQADDDGSGSPHYSTWKGDEGEADHLEWLTHPLLAQLLHRRVPG